MDVASLIVDAAAAKYEKECLESKCTVELSFCGAAQVAYVHVVPARNSVQVHYRTLKYQVERQDKGSYEEVCGFIADCIKQDLANVLDCRDGLYIDTHDHQLTLTVKQQAVAQWDFNKDRIQQELKRAMSTLRFMI